MHMCVLFHELAGLLVVVVVKSLSVMTKCPDGSRESYDNQGQ